MKKLLVLLLLANTLFATTAQNDIFLKKINETFTYSSTPIIISTYDLSTGENYTTIPKKENQPLWLEVEVLDNVEHNSSQKILKEKMDELVIYYLKTDSLFSNEALEISKENNFNNLRYDDFFKRLYPYLAYLEKHNDKKENSKLLSTLLNKALNDSIMLMKNSDDFLNYMVSLNMRKKLYAAFENLEDHKAIFQKYPLPKSELFFEKLELDKQNTLKMWEETEQQNFEHVSLNKATMQKIKDAVTLKFKPILNAHYTKAKVAILDDSEESMNTYKEHFQSIKKIDNPTLEKLKYTSSLYKVKVFEMIGIENDNFGNIPDVMVIVLAKMILPFLDSYKKTYKEHLGLEEIQEGLYNDQSK